MAGQPPELSVDEQLQEIINTPATDYTTISKKQATDAMGSKFDTQLDKRMAVDPEAKKQAVTETLSGPSQTPVLDAEGKPVIGPDGKPVYTNRVEPGEGSQESDGTKHLCSSDLRIGGQNRSGPVRSCDPDRSRH